VLVDIKTDKSEKDPKKHTAGINAAARVSRTPRQINIDEKTQKRESRWAMSRDAKAQGYT
jgi:uncharacterized DUF497 family protein